MVLLPLKRCWLCSRLTPLILCLCLRFGNIRMELLYQQIEHFFLLTPRQSPFNPLLDGFIDFVESFPKQPVDLLVVRCCVWAYLIEILASESLSLSVDVCIRPLLAEVSDSRFWRFQAGETVGRVGRSRISDDGSPIGSTLSYVGGRLLTMWGCKGGKSPVVAAVVRPQAIYV